MIDEKPIRTRYQAVRRSLDERGRRLHAAAEALTAGHGGVAATSRATKVARSTIGRGISLGNVGSAHRWRFVASGFDAVQEVPKVGLEVCLIILRSHAVDARCPILAGSYVGFSHPFEVDDMVQREQHRSQLLPRQFDYPMPFR